MLARVILESWFLILDSIWAIERFSKYFQEELPSSSTAVTQWG